MQRALALARRGEGCTRPNPPVGAVVIKGNRVLGEGYHRRTGGPHAEIYALRQAGRRTRGARLYVTLEPCSAWGRTPPCTDAIVAAGIAEVVAARRDPNPRHAGRGLRRLRQQGLRVKSGCCEPEATALLAPFSRWIRTRRPLLTLKMAMSLDGKIADRRGNARWISSRAARQAVHAERRRSDAIMVGGGTVIADDPHLLPRPAHGRRPYRVVVAGRRPLPLSARVLSDPDVRQTVVAVPAGYPAQRRRAMEQRGARVLVLPSRQGRVALAALVRALGEMGVMRVLCEGGAELAAALIAENLVDEYLFFVAPCIVGGRTAPTAAGGRGWPIEAQRKLIWTRVERCGRDLLLRARPAARKGRRDR